MVEVAAMCSEGVGRGHEPRNAGGLQKIEKARKTNSWKTHYCLNGQGIKTTA